MKAIYKSLSIKQRATRPPFQWGSIRSAMSSASTMATPPPRSYNTLTMDVRSYSESKKLHNGRCIRSDALVAGGHSWRISYYPKGFHGSEDDAMSIFLRMDDAGTVAGDVRVEFKFTLHDLGGGPPRFVSHTFTEDFGRRKPGLGLSPFVSHEEFEKSEILKHDSFTIQCDFAVVPPPSSHAATAPLPSAPPEPIAAPSAPPEPPAVMVPPPGTGLHADLRHLLETKEGADVDFEVCGKLFAVHKLVLAARSPVFKADFFGPAKEESTGYIRICDMNPEAFKALLHYMYTDTLPETMPFSSREEVALLAEGLLLAADRYDLKNLKLLIEDKMCKNIDVSTVLPMLALAEQHQCGKLKKLCLEFIASDQNTRATMALDDVERLARSHPSIVKEVITKILDMREREAAENVDWVSFSMSYIIIERNDNTISDPSRRSTNPCPSSKQSNASPF
ncbi:hypothetical protein EJB05_14487, partial [Eragrostis curvula]